MNTGQESEAIGSNTGPTIFSLSDLSQRQTLILVAPGPRHTGGLVIKHRTMCEDFR